MNARSAFLLKEQKSVIWHVDNLKPAYRVGEYACVKGDRLPGQNRPDVCGFVTRISGFGGALIVSVQMDKLRRDGCMHHNILLSFLAPAMLLFRCELELESPKHSVGDGPPKKKTVLHKQSHRHSLRKCWSASRQQISQWSQRII
jgi:hypothetical protein